MANINSVDIMALKNGEVNLGVSPFSSSPPTMDEEALWMAGYSCLLCLHGRSRLICHARFHDTQPHVADLPVQR